jgi:hypothetical protein
MLPFVIYFAAAVITGFHVYSLLAMTVYGIPFNVLEVTSLLGSFVLLIAAFISLFKPPAAARVALIACLLMWSFYGPAIANLERAKLGTHTALSEIHKYGAVPHFDNLRTEDR